MQYKLINVEQGTALIKNLWPKMKTALESGKTLVMNVEEEHRSNDQNAKFHVIIAQIAKETQHFGAKWDAESWKRFLIDQFATETGLHASKIAPSLDGHRLVQLGLQSRKFSKDQASQFVEWLEAWCADKGIELESTS
jgi:hypothetical protein